MSIDKLCEWKEIAESQRKNELREYGTDIGVKGFYDRGCYECNGNKKCHYNTVNYNIRVKQDEL